MGVLLQSFKFGWKALSEALNDLVVANNFNAPVEGAGIRIEQTGTGAIISRADMVAGARGGQGQGQGSLSQGLPPNGQMSITLEDISWVDIAVVDPVTCAQSTLSVLAKTPGTNLSLEVTYDTTTSAP